MKALAAQTTLVHPARSSSHRRGMCWLIRCPATRRRCCLGLRRSRTAGRAQGNDIWLRRLLAPGRGRGEALLRVLPAPPCMSIPGSVQHA